MYKNFHIERKDNIAIIIFDRPDINNAMENPLFRTELTDILDKIIADPEVRVAVLKNNGKFFCSGGNLKKFHIDLSGDEREIFLKGFYQRVADGEALINKIYTLCPNRS
jgi:enoyl-CoA hydratase/carnithine racemase